MKEFFKSKAFKICMICLGSLVLLAAAVCGGHYAWYYQLPKFQNVTIELGEELPHLYKFITEHAHPEKSRMVTDPETVDLSVAGQQELVFVHGKKEETVVLTIEDTVAPVAEFHDITTDIYTELKPEDFVSEVFDLSPVTVSFAEPLAQTDRYGATTVDVVVADAVGNKLTETCSIYYAWIHKEFTLELGNTLTKADLLLNPEKDDDKLDQTALDEINASPVGTYTITSTAGEETAQCVVTVQDTVAPTLEVRDVCADLNESVGKKSFIVSVNDASGEVTTKLIGSVSTKKLGKQTLTIEATDINGNVTSAQVTLTVTNDTKPPVFSGLTEMTVEKNSEPDFMTGVSAVDAQEGTVTFTYSVGSLDLSAAGTYYITYTASDSLGHTATARRKVVVKHNADDVAALVASVADSLPSDPEKLRDYVRNTIGYSSSWGGDDPIWNGYKNKTGNCYVHALWFDALLRYKGFQTQLIWVTDKSHYWNLVYINGAWKHMDATPSRLHGRYSIMNDAQRYETLSGRDWDRTAWPACS